MKYVIKDWAGNICWGGIEFDSFEDAWSYMYEKYEHLSDEEAAEEFEEYHVTNHYNEKEKAMSTYSTNIRFEIYPTEVYGSLSTPGLHLRDVDADELSDKVYVALRDGYPAIHLYQSGLSVNALAAVIAEYMDPEQMIIEPNTNTVLATFPSHLVA